VAAGREILWQRRAHDELDPRQPNAELQVVPQVGKKYFFCLFFFVFPVPSCSRACLFPPPIPSCYNKIAFVPSHAQQGPEEAAIFHLHDPGNRAGGAVADRVRPAVLGHLELALAAGCWLLAAGSDRFYVLSIFLYINLDKINNAVSVLL